jgi:hypothetical protein
MTAILLLNLLASIVVVGALATVCRLGYLAAHGALDERSAAAEPASYEPMDRLAA